MTLQPIGKIHTPHKTKEACPIQPVYASEAEGKVEVFEAYIPRFDIIQSASSGWVGDRQWRQKPGNRE
ncbi:MAG: hypothetical protein ABII68_11345 [Pseudomonadota bacterium]